MFHEITKEAIQEVLAHPRSIHDDFGARLKKRGALLTGSTGTKSLRCCGARCAQTLGRPLALPVPIVERERLRMAFVSATYWDLLGMFAKTDGQQFEAELVSVDGRKIPAGKDFDAATGSLKDSALLLLDEPASAMLVDRLAAASFQVTVLDDKPFTSKPSAPFTTIRCNKRPIASWALLRRAMQVAQSLYENGHITNMRTDSTTLAKVAVEAVRELVLSQYGREFLPDESRVYQTKVGTPRSARGDSSGAGHPFVFPEQLRGELNHDEFSGRTLDLEADRGQPNRRYRPVRRITVTHRKATGPCFKVGGRIDRFCRIFAGLCRGERRPQRPTWRNKTPCSRASRSAKNSRGVRIGTQEPHDAAAFNDSAKPG